MTDRELIEERIKEIETNLAAHRHSGRSTRIVSEAIDLMMSKPVGTQIPLKDHEGGNIRQLAQMFATRMGVENPEIDYKIIYPQPGMAYVERKTKNYAEQAEEVLKKWRDKLSQMDAEEEAADNA